MTSLRQIEANRCNATKSTGPKTEAGKMRSRRNAVRHGLSAETVIDIVEDIDDYKGFEAAVIADYDARTAVERELVLRLASLLWRLRRATAIETELLKIQAEMLVDRRLSWLKNRGQRSMETDRDSHLIPSENDPSQIGDKFKCHVNESGAHQNRDVALSFQRLVDLDSAVFERLGRYESALSRQVVQCMFFLRSARFR